MGRDIVIVITGPIGSGKSYVADLFLQHEWRVLDADIVGYSVLREAEVIDAVLRQWPLAVINSEVDRSVLAEAVFSDPESLRALEQITHPRIQQRITDWLTATPGPKAVEVSVLRAISPGWGEVVLVDAPIAVRKQRLQTRGLTAASISLRMAAQPTRGAWLQAAGIVLENREPGPGASLRLIGFLERRT